MDTQRFDALVRSLSTPSRRGLLAALVSSLLTSPLGARHEVQAKRKKKGRHKKRKRSTPPASPPSPSSPPPPPPCVTTCTGQACGGPDGCGGICGCTAPATCDATGQQCCNPEGTPCTSANFASCCSQTCDSLVGGGTCAPCRGRSCSATQPCCGGLTCVSGYCDGCRDRATSCTSNTQCCFSTCTSGACLSAMGGRCARDVDCRSCYLSHNCTNACVNGTCAV